MKGEIKLGSVVRSTQGRDKDKLFVVISIVNDEYVHLVDGDIRKLGNEKLKKVKHIKPQYVELAELVQKIADGSYVNDSDIIKALKGASVLVKA